MLPMMRVKNPADFELPDDVEALKAIVAQVVAEKEAAIASRDATITALQEQVQLLLARRFAASSERVADGQLGLFNEAEELDADTAPQAGEDKDAPVAVVGHSRRRRGKRAPIPEHLPRVEVLHELPEDERVCPHDGAVVEAFGEETSEQLDVVPAKIQVLRHRRVKYRCPCCEGRLLTAAMPPQPTPKSQASPGLLAFVATSKYVDGLPLYRLSKQFERKRLNKAVLVRGDPDAQSAALDFHERGLGRWQARSDGGGFGGRRASGPRSSPSRWTAG